MGNQPEPTRRIQKQHVEKINSYWWRGNKHSEENKQSKPAHVLEWLVCSLSTFYQFLKPCERPLGEENVPSGRKGDSDAEFLSKMALEVVVNRCAHSPCVLVSCLAQNRAWSRRKIRARSSGGSELRSFCFFQIILVGKRLA